jgi:hypothetical protein
MKSRPNDGSRGAALLVALFTVVVVSLSTLATARTATLLAFERETRSHTRMARDLMLATEPIITDWLERTSPTLVLPLETEVPWVLVHEVGFEAAPKTPVAIQIHALDQEGLAALDLGQALSGPLGPIPAWVLERTKRFGGDVPLDGLDRFADPTDSTVVFPSAPDPAGALGAHLRTHGRAVVNVHTASEALVERALLSRGLGGVEAIHTARAQGEPATFAWLEPDHDRGLPGIVGTSHAFAFRIDVTVRHLSRSWWCVFEKNPSGWHLVQRLGIPY